MANQVWNRLGQITSNYKNSQQTPSLNNNQYSSYYSKLYPGLTEESYNKMVNAVDGLGLTGENRTNAMNNYYRTHVKTLINDQTLKERDDIINQQAYEAAQLNNKDADAQLRMTEAVQKAKKLWNLDAKANDREVFETMVESLGDKGIDLAGKYLSGESNEFLVATGLSDKKDATKIIEKDDYYSQLESKINGALKGDWGKLSTNGLKYLQGWKLVLDATELAKAKGVTGTDTEIMKQVIKSSPKLQQKVVELQALQKDLTESDISILKGNTNKGINIGKSGFSLIPGVSLQIGDNSGMNISLVRDNPATYKDIQDLIDIKEKFGDNYVGELGNVAKVYANQPIDTLKKKGYQVANTYENIGTAMEGVWNDIMPKGIVELLQGKDMTDEEFEQYKQSRENEYRAMVEKNKEQVLKYNEEINKAFQKQVEQNLDPQIKEYYDNKTITELLALGDMQGVGYKQAQMVASNRDMLPNIVVTAINTPAGMTLMFGDSYARESQDSFERLIDAGATYDQADGISKVVGLINGTVEVGLDRLFGGVETTASKNLKNAFMKNLTEEATKKGFWEILGNIAKKQVGASLEEGAEEVIQEIVSNAAEMTIKDNPESADLFKGTWEAFEGGVFNPMNLMAGGSEFATNKADIQQSLGDAAYDAGVTARNIVDAGTNMKNNAREFIMDGAYNAGKGARNIVEWGNKVKEFMSRKKGNQTTNNVEVETTEKTEKPGILDRVTDWGAEKITDTVSPQDKLYKAQEPRMNTLTSKKNLENRRANSDRANQLIVENGYLPTNTAERVEAHQATLNKLWKQVKSQINKGKGITVDQTSIIEALENYIKEKKNLNIASIESDITALEKELESLKQSQADGTADLPVLENKKQVYNDIANWKEHEASKVYNDGIKLISAEIGKVEDNLLSQIPGEFSNLKKDVGALIDAYDDVFKADMKNQRSKGNGLTEAYSRIEGVSDIVNGIVGAFSGKGSLKSIAKGGAKILVGKSLAKAKNVDFLIEQGFKGLAKELGISDKNIGANPTDLTATETIQTQNEEVVEKPKTKKETKKTTKPKKKTTKK